MKQYFQAAKLRSPVFWVTALVSAFALGSLLAQLVYAQAGDIGTGGADLEDEGKLSICKLNRRIRALESCQDLSERDMLCLPLSATARALDRKLNPTACIFVDGALGNDEPDSRTFYFFLQNYLFPRDVEISVDGKAYVSGFEFKGMPFRSLDQLETNGFDALVRQESNGTIDVTPLSAKGAAK